MYALCRFISLSCPSLHPCCLIPFINCAAFSPLPFFWPFFLWKSITSVLLIHFCSFIFLFFIVFWPCKSPFLYPRDSFSFLFTPYDLCAPPSVSNSFYFFVTYTLSYWPPSSAFCLCLFFLWPDWLLSCGLYITYPKFILFCLPQCAAGTSSYISCSSLVLLHHFSFWTSTLPPLHWAAPIAALVYSTQRAERRQNYLKAWPLSEKAEVLMYRRCSMSSPCPSEHVGAGCEEGRIHSWCLLCSDYSALARAVRSRA